MTTIRTFIAAELPEQAKNALAELQSELKATVPRNTVRWTAPQNIHLTLHFLGNIAAGEVEQISRALEAAAASHQGFSLTLGTLGCFPNVYRPRVVWVGTLGDTTALTSLQSDIGARLSNAIDFKPDSRPYAPHLTIGRVKNRVPSRLLKQLSQGIQAAQPQIGQLARLEVTEIALMQSELSPTGAVYTQLKTSRLKNQG